MVDPRPLSESPQSSLGVNLNCPGRKHLSGIDLPLIAVTKRIKKTFLGTSHAIFNVQGDIFNKCHKLQLSH